jgi:hypothetical protein
MACDRTGRSGGLEGPICHIHCFSPDNQFEAVRSSCLRMLQRPRGHLLANRLRPQTDLFCIASQSELLAWSLLILGSFSWRLQMTRLLSCRARPTHCPCLLQRAHRPGLNRPLGKDGQGPQGTIATILHWSAASSEAVPRGEQWLTDQ